MATKLPFLEASGGSSAGAGTSGGSVSTIKDSDDGEEGLEPPFCGGKGEVLPTASVATTTKEYEPSGSEE